MTSREPQHHPRQLKVCVLVDVEEGFDWSQPFSSQNADVSALAQLNAAQDIFDRYGVVPSYLLTYPVAVSELGRDVIGSLLGKGKCIVGAQLHPWVTPPLSETINSIHSYPSNLDSQLEEEKIAVLVDAIARNFGEKPLVYRAGRYGFDLSRSAALARQGFKVDTSIVPYATFREQDFGPDFFGLPENPFWLNVSKRLLAIPLTQGLLGPMRHWVAPSALRHIYAGPLRRLKLPGVLSRLGLLERLRLTPEGYTLDEMKRLVRARIDSGGNLFCISFHSPSLAPGFTPYVRTEADVRTFLDRLDGILRFLAEELGASLVTPLDIHAEFCSTLAGDEEAALSIKGLRNLGRGLPVSTKPTPQRPRRILFVSGFLPPKSPMGAVRTAKLERHWRDSGHDVRTIAVDLPNKAVGNSPPPSSVYYLTYREPGRAVTRLVNLFCRTPKAGTVTLKKGIWKTRWPVVTTLQRIYRESIAFPDRYASWIGPAVRLALSWESDWTPDIIYSSGPPHSSHIAAQRLAARLHRPWIASLRDLWAGNPYDSRHALIEPLYDSLAKKVLSDADACVGVTNLGCVAIMALTNKPVLLSYNGYDPEDFNGLDNLPPFDEAHLTILHAGIIYPGQRDPTPLFKAIALLGEEGRKIRCLFYHDSGGFVAGLAQACGISSCVEIREEIPRAAILRLERQVDILLECRWQDAAGDGVIPGKLYEYIGARRPILSIGSLTGEAADIVRDNNLGLVSNNPEEIAGMLRESLTIKKETGRLPDLEVRNATRFQREAQFRKIDALMDVLLDGKTAVKQR